MTDNMHQQNVKEQIAKCLSMVEWFHEQAEKKKVSLKILEKALKDSYEVDENES